MAYADFSGKPDHGTTIDQAVVDVTRQRTKTNARNKTKTKERIKNYNFAVKEWRGEIIFLRNLVEGVASHSYGIHVARLAGLPSAVIERAKQILAKLEGAESDRQNLREASGSTQPMEPVQMALFGSVDRRLREELKRIDVSRMTPMEAMNLLHGLSEEAKK